MQPQDPLNALALEHMPVGILVFDPGLRIEYWNTFIGQRTDCPLAKALGEPLTKVFADADSARLQQLLAQQQSAQQPVFSLWREAPCLLQLTPPQGQLRRLQSTLLFAFADRQNQLHYCLALLDSSSVDSAPYLQAALRALAGKQIEQSLLIDKLEQANNQLLQSEKMAAIGQLAAGVAHEINNPIGFVSSNLRTLGEYVHQMLQIIDGLDSTSSLDELRQLKQDLEYDYMRGDIQALLGESEDGIQRVRKIITSLKDFSHRDADEFALADLHRGIETTLNVVANELKYKAEIIKEYVALPEVECIASQINQVVMNLLVNAAHAIERFGRITIRTGLLDQQVWLEVEDSGRGIEPRLLNRIFEPFFTTKPVGKGTGLGLSLSYNIVQKHHGRIEVFSQLDQGTRFRIWLPLRQPQLESLPEDPTRG
ncbi:MAG: ATP-binding protein [Pseudomonas sp.]|uniref:ATP-binding protein n=1 Tax=Pseudomonas sp. TaxID=306 RepID=UPI0033983E07